MHQDASDGPRAAGGEIRAAPGHSRPGRGGPLAAGFALVEVLVAVVVLSVGVLGVAALTLGVAGLSRSSARETDATLAAQRALDSIRRAGFPAAEDGRSTVGPEGREWTVAWIVAEVSSELKRVDLSITGGPGGSRGRSFTTRLHRPSSFLPAASSGGGSTSGIP